MNSRITEILPQVKNWPKGEEKIRRSKNLSRFVRPLRSQNQMGRFYHRRRSFNHWRYNETQREAVTAGIAGIDKDVLQICSSLDGLRRKILFNHYESAHGKSAANYAKEKMGDWATGFVNASGQTRSRLLALVPKILTHGERYGLLKKLYEAHRGHQPSHEVTVIFGHQEDFQTKIADLATSLCNAPDQAQLPPHVQSKISWVCDNDSVVARKIMAAIETEQSVAIAQTGILEAQNLVQKLRGMDASTQGTHTIVLPYGRISVHVRRPTFSEKIRKFFS